LKVKLKYISLKKSKQTIKASILSALSGLSYSHGLASMCDGRQCTAYSLLSTEESFDANFNSVLSIHNHNNEKEAYVLDQVKFKNGTVTLYSQRDVTYTYASGKVTTKDKFDINKDKGTTIAHGGVEVSAVIPYGSGRWPAIWMMPNYDETHPWPSGLEIDILEFMREPYAVTGTIHYGREENIQEKASWNYNNNEDLGTTPAQMIDDKVHKYGFEWAVSLNSVTLSWYFDGASFFEIQMDKTGSSTKVVMKDPKTGKTKSLFCQPWTNRCPSNFNVS